MAVADKVLIAHTIEGHSEAFGELVRRYQDRLYNTVHRLLGNAEDAQDVMQEAFFSAYQSLGHFKGDSQFFTWIYRIAVNTAISHKRKQKNLISIDAGSNEGGVVEPMDVSEFSRPGRSLEVAEEEQLLESALDRLSPEHRAVLVMKDIEGHKYETIAEVLEVPIGTIRSRLHRARLELRDVMIAKENAD